jgi:drug/metabolite transporter (DMT)-like permease
MTTSIAPSQSLRGLFAVIAGASALGFAAIFVKWGLLGGATPLTVGLYRMLVALPGIYLLARRAGPIRWNEHAAWALAAGVAFSLDLVFWHHSMNHTSAANATFIVCGLTPVWVALVSVACGRTHYGWSGWLGQVLGVAGAALLALARGARVGDGKGEFLAIVASVCYATFSLTITLSRRRLSAIQALFWMSLGSFGSFLLQELYFREPLRGYTPLAWFGLVGLGVVIQLLAWWLINSGLGHVPVALGALALGFQQVATPFLAAWLLDEALRPLGLLGGAVILIGIVLVATGERRALVAPSG